VKRSIAVATGKYALGLGLLAYVISRNWSTSESGPGLEDALKNPINWLAVAFTAACIIASAMMTFVRWFILVRAQELPFTLRDALRLGAIAYFFNAVLPSAIGGDVVKAVGLARKQSRRTVAVATVFFDRAVGLWGLIWIVSVLSTVYLLLGNRVLNENPRLFVVIRGVWILLGMSVVLWIAIGFLPEWRAQRFAQRLSRIPRIGGSLAEAWRATWMYRKKPRAVAAGLGCSFVSQAFYVLCYHHAVQVFAGSEQTGSLVEHSLIVPIGMAAQALIPTPGGIGGGELVFGKLYTMIGHVESIGVFGSLALRVTTWVVGFAGYLIGTNTRPSPAAEVESGESQ
jgi:uncharacterized protein (TIRG00374 family)